MIKVSDLHKSFGKLEVLKGIDENIEKGEKIVVIGPSGSGKSTFLRCLNLLETPTSGQIWFDGQCITDKKTDINRVRRSMGMVFQHFNLFNNKTVLGNITLAPIQLKLMNKEEANENALRLLELRECQTAVSARRAATRLHAFRRPKAANRHRALSGHEP